MLLLLNVYESQLSCTIKVTILAVLKSCAYYLIYATATNLFGKQ